jgi:Domain of unknown function (DUF4129)
MEARTGLRAAVFLSIAAVALAAAPAAAGSSATSSQVAALAARAGTDARALAVLRAVDRVNGRPVDLGSALAVSGARLQARLRTLAGTTRAGPPQPALRDPGASARSILSERRFRGSSVPRPLHRPLRWLGHELHRAYDWVTSRLPGGARLFWILVAGAVVVMAAFVASSLGRRRGGRLVEAGAPLGRRPGEDPRRLEREADEAERAGDFERALRLRFRGGLLRLAGADAIPPRASLTNGEIARRLRSPSFRELAHDFDEVVYGRRAAGGRDVARARDRWPRVLEEARSR